MNNLPESLKSIRLTITQMEQILKSAKAENFKEVSNTIVIHCIHEKTLPFGGDEVFAVIKLKETINNIPLEKVIY